MRFWITKNSDIPVHEQLVRQVVLAILSEDLPAGQKLPSVRALARRHHIHANTVSAAYHDLLEQGWLELRRGSGLYVRSLRASSDGPLELDRLLAALLQSASSQGHEPEDVLRRLEHLVRPRTYERILVVEPELAMREILQAEIKEHISIPVEAVEHPSFPDSPHSARALIVALPTRAAKVRQSLPPGVLCIPLKLRSVRASLEGQPRPGPNVVISIVSRSTEIRRGARAMLVAVGLDPECLCEVDANSSGWPDRLGLSALVITDAVAAKELPKGCAARVFRLIADSSIAELQQLCGG
jgi:DNA-binding transcriptional regulator YhcF (GntR family)